MMKLCYIWIEEYKGFRNQGFNFATDYFFNYSDSNITRSENEKHIKNFFGSGIINITGIIGKNASGKTNILELIQYITEGANTIINKPFFAVYTSGRTFIIYGLKCLKLEMTLGQRSEITKGKFPR